MHRHLEILTKPCCCPGSPPLEEGTAQSLATRFKALADDTRLSILRQLRERGEVCACDFVASCDVGQPTVSHHLKVLREAGLVEVARKRGTWVYYRLVPEAVGELAFALGGSGARSAA